jgi:simple sugar transport system permease protein
MLSAIAFLSRVNVFGIVLTCLFFLALGSGANVIQNSTGVPST